MRHTLGRSGDEGPRAPLPGATLPSRGPFATTGDFDPGSADLVGFATSTDFWGVPRAMEAFIEGLPQQNSKPWFTVLAGHSLRVPENYPPMIAGRMGAPNEPSQRRMAAFDSFVSEVAGAVSNALFPIRSRTSARDDTGEKHVDTSACTECGACARDCPYGAIRLDPKPVFDMGECYGCWRCYNRCPSSAIFTTKFRGGPYYHGPSASVKSKLGA